MWMWEASRFSCEEALFFLGVVIIGLSDFDLFVRGGRWWSLQRWSSSSNRDDDQCGESRAGEEMIRWSRQRLLLQKNRSDCAKTCLQRSTFKPLVKQGESKPANYQDCYCLYLLTKSSGITRQKNLPKQQIDATAFLWMQWLQRQILWIFWNPVSRGCRWPEAGWPLGPGWLLHRLFPRDQL